MVRVIMGVKGTGKTKQMIELINEAAKTEAGSVVCIERGAKLTYDIHNSIRLVEASDYSIDSFDALKGFVCGLYAGNYDISQIFIDSLCKIVPSDITPRWRSSSPGWTSSPNSTTSSSSSPSAPTRPWPPTASASFSDCRAKRQRTARPADRGAAFCRPAGRRFFPVHYWLFSCLQGIDLPSCPRCAPLPFSSCREKKRRGHNGQGSELSPWKRMKNKSLFKISVAVVIVE